MARFTGIKFHLHDFVTSSSHLSTPTHLSAANDEVWDVLDDLSSSITRWLASQDRKPKLALGADLNTALLADIDPIIGPHVLYRVGQSRQRLRIILDWLASGGFRPLNTWPGDITDDSKMYTWSNTRSYATQIDNVL